MVDLIKHFIKFLDLLMFYQKIEWQMKQVEKARSREMHLKCIVKPSSRESVKTVADYLKGI